MELNYLDIGVFFGFILAVVSIGIFVSRHEKDSESYFLAGRGLSWWLIGFSLIAANISTEQFVGMSGQAANGSVGLAIASYEWIAAITLVVVAFFFLPKFLRSGIYTISEFLEYRFDHMARTLMSLSMVVIYVGVTIATVIYSGAKTVDPLFGDQTLLGMPITIVTTSWAIGFLAAVYVAFGGLKACVWADLLQGSALIVGGAMVMFLAFEALDQADPASIGLAPEMADAGVLEKFDSLNADKMHMALPADSTVIPWTALMLGIWIPNFYYWGLNQYIMQRTLGAKSLAAGQKGIVFAAGLKLLIPFIVCVPGIIAFNLYKDEMREEAATSKSQRETLATLAKVQDDPTGARMAFEFNGDFLKLYPDQARQILGFNATAARADTPAIGNLEDGEHVKVIVKANGKLIDAIKAKDQEVKVQPELVGYDYDSAFGLLIRYLTPEGLRGFMLAAILGAVMSSLASMLNAASTIFTMDIYKQYINKEASQSSVVWTGRACVIVFVVIGCLIAPQLGDPKFKGIFNYIQEFQGFVSPGVLVVFLFGMFVRKAPRLCGMLGLTLSPIFYGLLMLFYSDMAFLDRMAIAVGALILVLGAVTVIAPLKEPISMPEQTKIEMKSSPVAKVVGVFIVVATVALYIYFW